MSAPREILNIAVIQAPIIWEQKAQNLSFFEQKIKEALPADLIVLPEMFTTGFSMNTALAEEFPGETLQWMLHRSKESDAAICASHMAAEGGHFFNRLIFALPNGEYFVYDKRHLFTLAGEQHYYTPGNKRLIVEYAGWKICPLICYDLRFPVWCRNTDAYDLLLFTANWPERRSAQWEMLLRARAIENQCYVAACNRVGNDGNDIYYDGRSLIADFLGENLAYEQHKDAILKTVLNHSKLQEFRERYAFLPDRDDFEIKGVSL